MSRTVTALYDSLAEAEAARARLTSSVNVESIDIIDQNSGSGLNDLYVSEEDRHAYGEGLRRGGYLLTAEVHKGEDADQIIHLLEETAGVDLDARQEEWRSEGWAPYEGGAASTAEGVGTAGNATEEERIPVIQEQLRVGKREVARGGARVRSYVREVPVQEQVTLREEHIDIERRSVEERLSDADLEAGEVLQERVIEVSEMKEEPVITKEAVVREELVVNKTIEQHTEQVEGTVRRTEVEVEETPGERPAFGGFGGGDSSRT